jgi:hypothetical protein
MQHINMISITVLLDRNNYKYNLIYLDKKRNNRTTTTNT